MFFLQMGLAIGVALYWAAGPGRVPAVHFKWRWRKAPALPNMIFKNINLVNDFVFDPLNNKVIPTWAAEAAKIKDIEKTQSAERKKSCHNSNLLVETHKLGKLSTAFKFFAL